MLTCHLKVLDDFGGDLLVAVDGWNSNRSCWSSCSHLFQEAIVHERSLTPIVKQSKGADGFVVLTTSQLDWNHSYSYVRVSVGRESFVF